MQIWKQCFGMDAGNHTFNVFQGENKMNFHDQLTQAKETYDGKPYKEPLTMTDEDRKRLRESYSKEHMARMKATIDYTRNKMGDMGI